MVMKGMMDQRSQMLTTTLNCGNLEQSAKPHPQSRDIETVLDYGGGGSDWDAPNFEPSTNESAKQFFKVKDVCTYEPSRNLLEKEKI